MAIDLTEDDLAHGDEAEQLYVVSAAASVLKDAWVFVRRRNSRLRFSNALVVRTDFQPSPSGRCRT